MLGSKSKSKKDSKKSSKKGSDPKPAVAPASDPPAPASSTEPAAVASPPATPSKDIKPSSSKKSSKKDAKKAPATPVAQAAPSTAPAAVSTPVPEAPSSSSSSAAPEPASSHSAPAHAASSSSGPASSSSSSAASAHGLTHIHALKNRINLADVNILAAGGSRHAHESILAIRAPRLAAFLGVRKGKKAFFKSQDIDLLKSTKQNISVQTLDVVLDYIYGDSLDLAALAPMLVLQTAVAARALDLPRLVRLCHDHLRGAVNMTTVFPMFIYSFAPDTKEETVFSYCLDFAHQHIKDFVTHKNEVSSLGMPLFQEIVTSALEDYKPLPVDNSPVPHSTLIADFQRLFNDTVQGGTGQADAYVMIGGTKIHFHKAILAAHADGFSALAPNSSLQDCSVQLVSNSDISADSFTAMLRYVYYGDGAVSPIVGCNLAPYCARFKLAGLQNICESHIASNIDANNVLSVLRVAYLPENKDRTDMQTLRTSGVAYVRDNLKSVDLSSLTQNPIIAVDILQAWKHSL